VVIGDAYAPKNLHLRMPRTPKKLCLYMRHGDFEPSRRGKSRRQCGHAAKLNVRADMMGNQKRFGLNRAVVIAIVVPELHRQQCRIQGVLLYLLSIPHFSDYRAPSGLVERGRQVARTAMRNAEFWIRHLRMFQETRTSSGSNQRTLALHRMRVQNGE